MYCVKVNGKGGGLNLSQDCVVQLLTDAAGRPRERLVPSTKCITVVNIGLSSRFR